MRARDLTITTSIAAVALSVSGMAATPAGHRDIVSIVVHSVSPLAVPAPSVDTIYAVPLKPTSAAI